MDKKYKYCIGSNNSLCFHCKGYIPISIANTRKMELVLCRILLGDRVYRFIYYTDGLTFKSYAVIEGDKAAPGNVPSPPDRV